MSLPVSIYVLSDRGFVKPPSGETQLATQWLAAVSVDVKALERDFTVTIEPWEIGDRFVPLYELTWQRAGRPAEWAARVELVEPDHRLHSLVVQKPQYLTRRPLTVLDREKLLRMTNAPAVRGP